MVDRKSGDLDIDNHIRELINSKEAGNRWREGCASFELGIAYFQRGDFKKAIERGTQSLSIAKEMSDKILEARAYWLLGRAYNSLGDFDAAVKHLTKYLSIARELGRRTVEGTACCRLGSAYEGLRNFEQAIEFYKLHLSIAKEVGDRCSERCACQQLGDVYLSLGNFKQAVEFSTKSLSIAKELGNRTAEGTACCRLGSAYKGLRNFEPAIEFYKLHLSIAKEVGDRCSERCACQQLGDVYLSLGNFKQAVEFSTKSLSIAKELGNRTAEGTACCRLGSAYKGLCNFEAAIEFYKLHLSIAKEVGDRCSERCACEYLGDVYRSLGNFKQAVEYHTKSLSIAQELGNRTAEGRTCCGLGLDYKGLRNFEQAIEYYKLHLSIAKEEGGRVSEACACKRQGGVYFINLGNFKQAIKYYTQHLSIAKELGDRDSEESTYECLSTIYGKLGDLKQAIDCRKQHFRIAKGVRKTASEGKTCLSLGEYHNTMKNLEQATKNFRKGLNIAKEVGDRLVEVRAYCSLGNVYLELGDLEQAMEYFKQQLAIAKELRDKGREGSAYFNLGLVYYGMGNFEKAIEYHKLSLSMSKESGDRLLEGNAYARLGLDYESLASFSEAIDCYQSSIEILDSARALLQSEDAWKIGFRDLNSHPYTGLWRTLLKKGEVKEALCAAEKGRAQALIDVLKTQYGVDSQPSILVEPKETISQMLNDLPTQAVFVALDEAYGTINFWVLGKSRDLHFEQTKIEPGLASLLLETTLTKIDVRGRVICENRSMDELSEDSRSKRRDLEETQESSTPTAVNSLRGLYDVIIGPIADLLHGDQLIIVPDGPFCLFPYSALSESTRIRTVPSLTALKLITGAPEDFHFTTGALVVGDPCLKEVSITHTDQFGEPLWKQLGYAREEAKMVGKLLNTTPLIGIDATKDEVLKRLKSVALVHIAAHGCTRTGEIVLTPKSDRTSQILEKQDFILTMSDVQAVCLRARLVVLSCCHSGRGEVKSEGVVGLARAFLCAGARSVLVSLWAIDDEATLMFMRNFYQHLADGTRASVALHQAMKSLRESQEFRAVKYWAPFVLIGDDVSLEIANRNGENGESSLRLTLNKSNFICK